MIIILKGADFSANNIGTLSTWSITRVLGSGAIYSGPSYVEKGYSFSATVTISEGYELGAAGVTVTMGGTPVTSGVSTGNSTIVINISSVTGNIVIKVPTVNVSGGEEVINSTLTINPTPTTATVTLSATGYSTVSGTGSKSITVANGTKVNWSVSASGYTTKTGTYTITNSNYNLTVTLDAETATTATLTVNPTPSNANVSLYAKGYSQSGKSITVPNDGSVSPSYQVYKDNYLSQGGTVAKIKSSQVLDIILQPCSDGNWTDISSTAEKVADYFVVDSSGRFNGPYSTWCHWIVPITPGKKYRITGAAGQSARLWGFYTDKPKSDGSVKPISVSPNNGITVSKLIDEVIAPEGAVYLVVNNRINSTDTKAIIEVLN